MRAINHKQTRFRGAFRAWILCIIVGLFAEARAEIKTPSVPPPQPVPISVEVYRGQSVEIPLRTYGSSRLVTFRIRSNPQFGSLGEPRLLSDGSTSIVYTHSGNRGSISDSFSYAARGSRGVSAPVSVTISIIDPPGVLQIPATLNLGEVLVGKTAHGNLVLENSGGATVSGRIETTPPWSIEGAEDYQLAGGEKQSFRVVFAPNGEGNSSGRIRYSSDPGRETVLTASARSPFSIEPKRIEARLGPDERTRSGSVRVANRTAEPLALQIEAGPRLRGPRELTLAPNTSEVITFSSDPADGTFLSETISFRGPNFSTSLPFSAAPVPSRLQVEPAELSLGKLDLGAAAPVSFQVTNAGGTVAKVRLSTKSPFALEERAQDLDLAPGETKSVSVKLIPKETGRLLGQLTIDSDTQSLPVRLSAEVRSPAVEPPAPNIATGVLGPSTIPQPTAEAPIPGQPPIPKIGVTRIGARDAELRWEPGAADIVRYRVEIRRAIVTQSKTLEFRWEPFEAAILPQGPVLTAKLVGLEPQQLHSFRVLGIDKNGDLSKPSPMIQFFTKPEPKRVTLLRVLLVVFGVLMAVLIRRRFTRPLT